MNKYYSISKFGREQEDVAQNDKIYKNFKKPIILVFDEYLTKKIIQLAKICNFKIQLVASKINHYVEILPRERTYNSYNSLLGNDYLPFVNDKSIIAYPNIGVDRYFNSGHPIIQHILNKERPIYNNSSQKKLFEDLISLIKDFIFNVHLYAWSYDPDDTLIRANKILSLINSINGTKFKLEMKDFPTWVSNEIYKQKVNEKKIEEKR